MFREGRWRYIFRMASIGYARVSTREQNPDGQTDLLSAAGCEKVFVEHASGVLAKRPVLDDALDYLRAGDTLVVTKLDRLGRSVRNLKEVAEGLQAARYRSQGAVPGHRHHDAGGSVVLPHARRDR